MTNSTAQWEQALLNKVTSNGERIAVVENRLNKIEEDLSEVKQTTKKIESLLGGLKWIGGGVVAIALSLIANFAYSFLG
ncbi:hypothetical protein Xen7305DRAFT_00008610 [Xenococcus sp. PCC 7305]|uniref:hypothetical protein n=1 Tax=Xenococcus sp. PCC 7305 TaxID=102125 RepID=UPI0002ABE129|nr:hypothetical protein [Xenococcus sp. PCC 7305]ELS01159.1 hypothetical protein Xen7305DRAFT_00008610 [Xenococcus sp. PCC 7305]